MQERDGNIILNVLPIINIFYFIFHGFQPVLDTEPLHGASLSATCQPVPRMRHTAYTKGVDL
jgi:hypothetical protein